MFSSIEKVGAVSQAPAPITLTNPISSVQSLTDLFGMIINIILGVGWALVFVMLAMGFIQYVMSKGEKVAVENAQKWLTYAVIGGVGLFFVMVVRTIVVPLVSGTSTSPWSNVVNF